jgi:DNA-binding beta-propeller fold protein YncE
MLGTGNGQFVFPADITVDRQGNFYVADGNNHRVQKFDAGGQWLANIGSDLTDFWPQGVAMDDTNDELWVADWNGQSGQGLIRKFDSGGNLIASWGSEISNYVPVGLALDAAGNLYVSDNGPGNCIRMFDASGNNVATWSNYSPGNGQFSEPAGLALSGNNLYVADNRTLVLAINATPSPLPPGTTAPSRPRGQRQ